MPSINAQSLRILVWSPTLIGLNFPQTTLVNITRKRKQFLTCTQKKTTRANPERLRSARLIEPLNFYRLPIPLSIAYYCCLSFIGINKVVK
jgi:hypothetical protein